MMSISQAGSIFAIGVMIAALSASAQSAAATEPDASGSSCRAIEGFSIANTRFESGDAVAVTAMFDEQGMPVIRIELTDRGAARFAVVQQGNPPPRHLPICFAREVIANPVLTGPVAGKDLQIAGLPSFQVTQDIAGRMRALLVQDVALADARKRGKVYRYRFTLLNPHTGLPMARQPFALLADGYPLPEAAATRGILQGTTDARGRTPIIRLMASIAPERWHILERVGAGPAGQSFQMVTAMGDIMADYGYQMVLCTSPPTLHRGYTDRRGFVAYAASAQDTPMRIVEGHDTSEAELAAVCQSAEPSQRDGRVADTLALPEAASRASTIADPH